jgi:predicted O-methyltransferase YrrM
MEAVGDEHGAVALLEEITRTSPEVLGAPLALGQIFTRYGRSTEAVELLRGAAGRYSANLQLRLALADALLAAGQPDDAVTVLDRALESRPNTASLWKRKAVALEAVGRMTAAWCVARAADATRRTESALADIAQAPVIGTRWDLLNHCVQVRPDVGLVLEFGVAAGMSARYLAQRVPKVYGFDSFAGLPEESDAWEKGQFAQAKLPVVPDNVELVVGWYDETLGRFLEAHPGAIGLLHIDCDIYSSTKYVLDQVRERLVPGTVILFDELWRFGGWENHEWRAFDECLLSQGVTARYIGRVDAGSQVAIQVC